MGWYRADAVVAKWKRHGRAAGSGAKVVPDTQRADGGHRLRPTLGWGNPRLKRRCHWGGGWASTNSRPGVLRRCTQGGRWERDARLAVGEAETES